MKHVPCLNGCSLRMNADTLERWFGATCGQPEVQESVESNCVCLLGYLGLFLVKHYENCFGGLQKAADEERTCFASFRDGCDCWMMICFEKQCSGQF